MRAGIPRSVTQQLDANRWNSLTQTILYQIKVIQLVAGLTLDLWYFTAVRLPICTYRSYVEGIRLSEHSPRKWVENVARNVGISCSKCTMLYRARKTQGTKFPKLREHHTVCGSIFTK